MIIVSGYLVDDDRVNVAEVWADLASLTSFRGEGIEEEQAAMLREVVVREYDASPR